MLLELSGVFFALFLLLDGPLAFDVPRPENSSHVTLWPLVLVSRPHAMAPPPRLRRHWLKIPTTTRGAPVALGFGHGEPARSMDVAAET